MRKVIRRAIAVATIPYAIVGIFGYITFARHTENLTKDTISGVIILANYDKRFEMTIVYYLKRLNFC